VYQNKPITHLILGCSYRASSVRIAFITIYFDVDIVGFYFLFCTCFIEPNGRSSLVQPWFDVTVFICVSCLFGVDEF